MDRISAIAFVLVQRVLPRYLLTAFVYRLARIRLRPIKDIFIRGFVALYNVDVGELDRKVPQDYATFNQFFTRALAAGQRPVDDSPHAIVSPVDGTLSRAGSLEKDQLLQAKGIYYSLADLLATDLDDADRFVDGHFMTIYLAPYNYHRVHSPLAGELVAARYVPGDLFSVNAATVSRLPGLFARNERLVCHFDSAIGPLILILVGAMNVGSISTNWSGEIRPRKTGMVSDIDLDESGQPLSVSRAGLLGWFNMGSTVIMLTPPGSTRWRTDLTAGCSVRMGERIGTVTD